MILRTLVGLLWSVIYQKLCRSVPGTIILHVCAHADEPVRVFILPTSSTDIYSARCVSRSSYLWVDGVQPFLSCSGVVCYCCGHSR